MNGKLKIKNSTFSQNQGQILLAYPNNVKLLEIPASISIVNSTFTHNKASTDGIFVARTNSHINVTKSSFLNNRSPGRGGVALADSRKSSISFHESILKDNYG